MSKTYPREVLCLQTWHLAALKCWVWGVLEVVILTLCIPNFPRNILLPWLFWFYHFLGSHFPIWLVAWSPPSSSVSKRRSEAWAYTASPHSTVGSVSPGAVSFIQEVVIFAFAFPATKNDHPRVSCFSKPTRLLYEVLEIWARKCQLAQTAGDFSKSNLFFCTISTVMCLPSVLYSLASCYTGKKKFNRTHSLMDWTSFYFILLINLQMKIWGNNGETCPKCQTMEQNEMLRSSCEIPQWISSQRSAREELGCATCSFELTLRWKLAQRGKMPLFLALLAFSQQGPVASSQVSKRTMIDGWICNGENILLLPHV